LPYIGDQQHHPIAAPYAQPAQIIGGLVGSDPQRSEAQLLFRFANAPERQIAGRQVVEKVERPVEPIHLRPVEFLDRRIVISVQSQQQITCRDKRLRIVRHDGDPPVLGPCGLF
jgi:hypothetical protein